MVDRVPTHIVSGGETDRFYIYDNCFICNGESTGPDENSWTLYNLMSNSTEMVVQYSYKYDSYENETNPWFKSYDCKEWESISEDEFNEGVDYLKAQLKSDMKPLSEF